MKLKKLSKEHISQIIQLEKENTPGWPVYGRYDRKTLETILSTPKKCKAYGLFVKDKLVGWGAYRSRWKKEVSKGVYEICALVVDGSYRTKGLGDRLLKKVISDIRKKSDLKKITTITSPDNNFALIFYLKRGFKIVAYKKDWYGKGIDRLQLELT